MLHSFIVLLFSPLFIVGSGLTFFIFKVIKAELLTLLAPVGPAGPAGPFCPAGPCGPVGPCKPCGQVGPCFLFFLQHFFIFISSFFTLLFKQFNKLHSSDIFNI
jgi:hypothetical protein